jgi:hypothetical protein
MPQIDYPRVIVEDQEELKKLEKRHRYSHLFHRVRMLRLLKSRECSNLGDAAKKPWATADASARGGFSATSRRVWRSFW